MRLRTVQPPGRQGKALQRPPTERVVGATGVDRLRALALVRRDADRREGDALRAPVALATALGPEVHRVRPIIHPPGVGRALAVTGVIHGLVLGLRVEGELEILAAADALQCCPGWGWERAPSRQLQDRCTAVSLTGFISRGGPHMTTPPVGSPGGDGCDGARPGGERQIVGMKTFSPERPPALSVLRSMKSLTDERPSPVVMAVWP